MISHDSVYWRAWPPPTRQQNNTSITHTTPSQQASNPHQQPASTTRINTPHHTSPHITHPNPNPNPQRGGSLSTNTPPSPSHITTTIPITQWCRSARPCINIHPHPLPSIFYPLPLFISFAHTNVSATPQPSTTPRPLSWKPRYRQLRLTVFNNLSPSKMDFFAVGVFVELDNKQHQYHQ